MKKFGLKLGASVALVTLAFAGFVGGVWAQIDLGTTLRPEVGGNPLGTWDTVIPGVITLVFVVAAALTFAYLIMGAISWITSGGDKTKVEGARNRITAAVIGLLILAAVWAIFQIVLNVAFGSTTGFKLESLNSSSSTPAPVVK